MREDVSSVRDARRTIRYAVLNNTTQVETGKAAKLNANQQTILTALHEHHGKMPIEALRELRVPATTLGTLVRREFIEIIKEPADFHISSVPVSAHPPRSEQLNEALSQFRISGGASGGANVMEMTAGRR